MYCRNCGNKLEEGTQFCPYCGTPVDPQVGTSYYNASQVEDRPSIGLTILSFLFPFIGIIYYVVKHKDVPEKAKACLIASLVSILINIVAYGYLL